MLFLPCIVGDVAAAHDFRARPALAHLAFLDPARNQRAQRDIFLARLVGQAGDVFTAKLFAKEVVDHREAHGVLKAVPVFVQVSSSRSRSWRDVMISISAPPSST